MRKFSRGIAILLCLVMLLGMFPAVSLAAEESDVPAAAVDMSDIDFTKAAAAERFTIVNQNSTEIREGDGLYMVSTMNAFETAGDQLSGDAATTPVDLVKIPVSGDWTATLNFDFEQGSSLGYYEFFGFYASEGDDYQNLAGIRGADGNGYWMLIEQAGAAAGEYAH